MEINTNDYKPNEILRFMRDATNLSQSEFAKKVGKSTDWLRKNEYGITNYYFKDLVTIAKMYGFTITIKKDEQKKNS